MENAGWYLADVPGIDVLLLGHSHTQFPGPRYVGMQNVDATHGFVRTKPAVMGGFFGKDLGVIQLVLERQHGRWMIDYKETHSEVRPICSKPRGPQAADAHAVACVPADPAIAPLVQQAHAAAINYVNTPIGEQRFAHEQLLCRRRQHDGAGAGQRRASGLRAARTATLHPELAGVPVLSAAAAFRTGFGGPDDYTDVAAGPLTLRSAADLYFYPEHAGRRENRWRGAESLAGKIRRALQPDRPAPGREQQLINCALHRLQLRPDPGRHPLRHRRLEAGRPAHHHVDLSGKPVDADPAVHRRHQQLPRQRRRPFPRPRRQQHRAVRARWQPRNPGELAARPTHHRRTRARTRRSWRFAPLRTRGPVVFTAASGKEDVARAAGIGNSARCRITATVPPTMPSICRRDDVHRQRVRAAWSCGSCAAHPLQRQRRGGGHHVRRLTSDIHPVMPTGW